MARKPKETETTQESSIKPDGVCSFEITENNNRKLKALLKYAEMLDYIAQKSAQEPIDSINADGVINELLDDITDKRVKALAKKHSFEDDQDFIDCLGMCENAERAFEIIQNSERAYYRKAHAKILEQIPVDDKQARLPL